MRSLQQLALHAMVVENAFHAAQQDVLPLSEKQEEALLTQIMAANAQQFQMIAALGLA